ncbi:hypothetical protein [Mycoplasma leachii]|uniref:hypothetical protein n=1 Tax=Mycoplasma leachii TaxID=2105 RepID=UPI003DA3DAD3
MNNDQEILKLVNEIVLKMPTSSQVNNQKLYEKLFSRSLNEIEKFNKLLDQIKLVETSINIYYRNSRLYGCESLFKLYNFFSLSDFFEHNNLFYLDELYEKISDSLSSYQLETKYKDLLPVAIKLFKQTENKIPDDYEVMFVNKNFDNFDYHTSFNDVLNWYKLKFLDYILTNFDDIKIFDLITKND